jgi:hypothetical protein
MSLRGTLGDFGLPDIFQLVGHQQKTGVLLLKDREIEVRIYFVDGNVVKAEESSRERNNLLGALMVRGGCLTPAQLDAALATQQRTLRRLGDILIEMNVVDRATIKDFARLQTTETIYRLFMWRKGTYEFSQTSVDYDEQSYDPIRAENILMEGFRMVDEWPSVRKIVPSSFCTFTVIKDPPAPGQGGKDDDDILAGMKEAFGDESSETAAGPVMRKIGENERRVFSLVTPLRTVQDIIDLSRLGEFETTKSLAALVQNGCLRVVLPKIDEKKQQDEPFTIRRVWGAVSPVAIRVMLYAVVAGAVGGLVKLASTAETGVLVTDRDVVVRRAALQDKLGDVARLRIEAALETYRLVEGKYPAKLDELVVKEYLDERELSFPFESRFSYRTTGEGFVLALPLR